MHNIAAIVSISSEQCISPLAINCVCVCTREIQREREREREMHTDMCCVLCVVYNSFLTNKQDPKWCQMHYVSFRALKRTYMCVMCVVCVCM